MKRSPIRRKSWLKRSSKPIPKVNSARQEKRRKVYARKLAAYRKSECYKEVEARAQGQCEKVTYCTKCLGLDWHHGKRCESCGGSDWGRCPVKRGDFAWLASPSDSARLTHHHLTYRRFGGAERPADIIVLCERHNAEAEAKHPTRQRNYRRSA